MLTTDDYARAGGGLRDDQRPTTGAAVARMQGTEMCARLGLLTEEEATLAAEESRDGHVVIGGSVPRQVDCRTNGGGGGGGQCPSNPSSTFALLTAAAMGEDGCGGGTVGDGGQGGDCCLVVRKSANMTECVAVPSSEHVAEIVGRQGKTTI